MKILTFGLGKRYSLGRTLAMQGGSGPSWYMIRGGAPCMGDEVTAMNIPEGTNMRYFTVCTRFGAQGGRPPIHRTCDHDARFRCNVKHRSTPLVPHGGWGIIQWTRLSAWPTW